MKLTIIIPARNEEKTILRTLQAIKSKVKVECDVIVVNDRSNDSTEILVRDYSRKNRHTSIISTTKSRCGFSEAIMLGLSKVRSGAVLTVMADLCDDMRTINVMYNRITTGEWDVVCGSRYMKGGKKIGGPKLQGLLSEFVCRSLKILVGLSTNDVSNSFKMYKKEVLKKIVINKRSGFEVSMEIFLQAFFNGARATEVPTVWKGRTLGVSKFKLIQRAPKYGRIYFWAIENSCRKRLGMKLKKFYK